MNTKKQESHTDTIQDELTKRGRDVWLAGLGALATVEKEGTKLFGRLVDRGKQFEEARRKELEAVREKAEEQGEEALEQIEDASEETQTLLTDTVNRALERFGVPTRTEVDRLAEKVDTLANQVDELTESLSEATDTERTNGDGSA